MPRLMRRYSKPKRRSILPKRCKVLAFSATPR